MICGCIAVVAECGGKECGGCSGEDWSLGACSMVAVVERNRVWWPEWISLSGVVLWRDDDLFGNEWSGVA